MSDLGIDIGAPPPSVEEDEVPPIGVPPGYRARTGPAPKIGGIPGRFTQSLAPTEEPRYRSGDELSPSGWTPERIADLQAQMVDVGLLSSNKYQRGFWDGASIAAYEKLLAYSNAAGLDYQGTLQRYREVQSKFGQSTPEGPVRQPLVVHLSDPASLRELVDDISVRRIGRGLTPEEKERFANSFRGIEEQVQRQQYEMTGSGLPGGEGGTITDPDPQAQAAEFIKAAHPDEIQYFNYIQGFKAFEDLLSRSMRR